MHLSEKVGIEGHKFVVTGGLGFVGSGLCKELMRRGAQEVRTLDPRSSSPWSHHLSNIGVHFIQGDVSQRKDVEKALQGADCVFHLASYGMSGKEMLQARRIDEVNIDGTSHVLDACHEFGIKRLVYVSTHDVVFGGKEIINGNETLPYASMDAHVDPYSWSKCIAEQLVLKSNGRLSKKKDGTCLYTCVIRPAGIYGPGEERHLPRIISLAKLGLLIFKIGNAGLKTDWVYSDNLILALILASRGLLDDIPGKEGRPIAAGQPYFISDGSPVNSYEFIGPLLRSLGYDFPNATVDIPHALLLGQMFWSLYTFFYPWLNRSWLPQPLLLPAEVYKVGVTHYFSNLKAKEELGYVPIVSPQEGMSATISYWQDKKKKTLDRPTIYARFLSIIGMSALFFAAYLPDFGPVKIITALCLFFLQSLMTIRIVFLLLAATHVLEGMYAWNLANKVDPANAKGWFWQTLVFGFPSLRLLLKKSRKVQTL